MDLTVHYQQHRDACQRLLRLLRNRSHAFVIGEISSFIAILAFIALAVTVTSDVWQQVGAVLAVLSVAAYVIIRRSDSRNDDRIHHEEDVLAVYDHELQALQGDYSAFDSGQRYVDQHHPFSFDLDLFGTDSVYQRFCRTATTGGSDALAERLARQALSSPSPSAPVSSPSAIDVLAGNEAFRTQFIAYGVRQKIDTDAIRKALAEARGIKLPRWARSLLIAGYLDRVLVLPLIVVIAMAIAGEVSAFVPLWWAIIQFFVVYALCLHPLRDITAALDRLHGQLRQFIHLVELMQRQPVQAFYGTENLLDALDSRGNILGLVFMDTFFLRDLFILRQFTRWCDNDAADVEAWIDRVIQKDQDVTVATLRFNHPETAWPVFTDDHGVHVEAQGLWHPFLGAKAVRNDFRVDDRNFYIITGANMAGKSTFLRAVGVNVILARAGFPVFADHLTLSRFRLFSSMRTTDDLTHGISYFNAELLRLKQLISFCSEPHDKVQSSLIILDEILKGTNSADKLNGSRMFLEYISQKNVSGIIATHDLELSKMDGPQFHNYCFEIELGTAVTYSYRITPGVARNQNATFLLREMLYGKKSSIH